MEFPGDNPASGPSPSLLERRAAESESKTVGNIKVEEEPSVHALEVLGSIDSVKDEPMSSSEAHSRTGSEAPSRNQSEPPSASGAHQSGSDGETASMPKAKVFTRRKAGQTSAGRQPGKDPLVLEYNDLVPFFKVSQRQACTELGIGLSTMKRLCRKFGIKRWPGSLLSPADAFSWCTCTCKHHGGPSATSSGHQEGCPHATASPTNRSEGVAASAAAVWPETGPSPSKGGWSLGSAGAGAGAQLENDAVPSVTFNSHSAGGGSGEVGAYQDLFMSLELEGGEPVRDSPLEEREGVFATSKQDGHWLTSIDDEWLTDNLNQSPP